METYKIINLDILLQKILIDNMNYIIINKENGGYSTLIINILNYL